MQITKNAVALIHYTLKDDAGEVIDKSQEGTPMPYIHGHGNLIPGLESELEGKELGDKLNVRIEPKDAYGDRNEEMVQDVPRAQLPQDVDIQPGMQFQAQNEGGMHVVTVVGVEEDQVRLDGNHPLAGVTLNFDVEIAEVRQASSEELEHGHVHGPGGHQH
jgi:FKBP-type peptidyl-prolyl cis-trans isomerase SlyD